MGGSCALAETARQARGGSCGVTSRFPSGLRNRPFRSSAIPPPRLEGRLLATDRLADEFFPLRRYRTAASLNRSTVRHRALVQGEATFRTPPLSALAKT